VSSTTYTILSRTLKRSTVAQDVGREGPSLSNHGSPRECRPHKNINSTQVVFVICW